jgi:hypothetical protein
MANFGHFLGGMQEGMSERRKFELDKTTKEEELALGKKRVGLQAAELAANTSMAQQRLALDKEKEANDRAYRGSTLSLQERQLQLQAENQRFLQEQAMRGEVEKVINTGMDTIRETITHGREAGQTPEQLFTAVKPFVDRIHAITSQVPGMKPELYTERIQTMLAQPTAAAVAAGKGKTAAEGNLAQAQAYEAGGVPRAAAQHSAGITNPTKVGEYDAQAFTMPDGTQVSVRKDDGPGMTRVIQQGGVPISLSVRATEADGITPVSGPNPKAQQKSVDTLRKGLGNVEELERTLKGVQETHDSVGFKGQLIEVGGGILGQIPIVGDEITEKIPGYEKVIDARSKARTSIAQSLQTITGDPSRYTDRDVELARDTLGSLKPTADWKQVVAAYKTVIGIQNRQLQQDVDELRVAAKITVRDLSTPEGINKFADVLINRAGVPPKRAEQMVLYMLDRFDIKLSADKPTK